MYEIMVQHLNKNLDVLNMENKKKTLINKIKIL